MQTGYRLGIDAGGTFTDFVLASADGQVRLFKALSTPADPARAIAEGLRLIAEATGERPEAIVRDADLCINGTTVGLNALIQHKGAKTGLICTAGHEDSIEIRLGHKEDGYRYDPEYPAARMLVPRYLRRGVRERVISNGSVHTALHEEDVVAACELFRREGVESVAISFVWSVINPAHERRAAGIVRQMLPDVLLTVGSDLYPQVREYTRTSTAVVNAYLGPILRAYVDAVDGYFRALGAKNPVRYFQSNGGLATGAALADRSVYAINSGPASAPAAGLHFGKPFGHENIITIDMGGTSFDITLTKAGRTNIAKDIDFLRYRLGIPMIQVETLGAGGGSIARIDAMGLLQVGPQSAGADPGPACYGQGGTRPTVTDANLVLGYLSPRGLVGGRLPLDEAKARAAVETIAKPLGLSAERAAYGIFTIVNANMVNGIRRVSVEKGDDPRDFVLVGAGGATAAHITALAREMGIRRILIPKLASGLCAFGQIISDVKLNAMAPFPARLEAEGVAARLAQTFAGLEAGAVADLMQDGFPRERIAVRRALDMRYVGQVHECTVEIGDMEIAPATLPRLRAAFDARHRALYTYAEPQTPVEIVNIEAAVHGLIEKPRTAAIPPGRGAEAARTGTRDVVMSPDGARIAAAIYDGARLGADDAIAGPAIVEEETTTIVIEPGWTARLDASGSYVIERAA
jgi:N-methylhydantoinase A